MSETSEIYSRWYDRVHAAELDAQGMTRDHEHLTAPSERLALAHRAREAARWQLYLAETLELRQP